MSGKIKILIVTDSAVLPSGMAETTRLFFGHLLNRYPGVLAGSGDEGRHGTSPFKGSMLT